MLSTNGNPRGEAGAGKGASGTVRPSSIATDRPGRPASHVGGPRWRRACGLMTVGDLVQDFLRYTPRCRGCGGPVIPRTRRPPVCRDCADWNRRFAA